MTTNLLPISSDGGFITAGNITTASYASPAPSLNGFSSIVFADGSTQTTAFETTPQYGYFNEMTYSGNTADAQAIAIDADGNTYVSYVYFDSNASVQVGGVAKFAASGARLWSVNLQSPTGGAQYSRIASLEYTTLGSTPYLVAIGTYYNGITNLNNGFMWMINPADGTVGTQFDTEVVGSGYGIDLYDAVFGSDSGDSAYAVLVGNTYNQVLNKTLTPISPSTTDKLYITWSEFNSSGLQPGDQIVYQVGGYFPVNVNMAVVPASIDGTTNSVPFINLRVSYTQAGQYRILGTNGWAGDLNAWTSPVALKILGSNLGGTDITNDLTFDFNPTIFSDNSQNLAAAVSNIAGTPISDVYCQGSGGLDWGTAIGSPVEFQYYLNDQAYISRIGSTSWSKNLGSGDSERIISVAVDSNDNIYAVGYYPDGISRSGIVIKYDITGTQQWAVYIDPTTNLGMTVYSVDIMADGNIICVGGDGIATKINSLTGEIIWQVIITDNVSWDSDFKGTATPDGNYIFTNYEDNNYRLYVMCLSGADGSVQWTKEIRDVLDGNNGEIYPQNDFDSQYIDSNSTQVVIAATRYNNNASPNDVGLVINFPNNGENVDGAYGQYIVSSYSFNWNTLSTTAVAATVNSLSISATLGPVSPSNNSINLTINTDRIGGSDAVNIGNVTFDNQIVIGTGDEYGGSGLFLAPGANSAANLQYLRVRGGDFPTHIHFDTGNNDYYEQYFGDDNKYLKLEPGLAGNIKIGTYQDGGIGPMNWVFDSNGTLTLPNGSNIADGNLNGGTASASVALNAFSPSGDTVSVQAQGNTSSAVISIFSNAGPVTSNWTFTTAPLDPSESFLYIPNGGTISTPNATGGEGGKNIFIQAGASDPVTWNSNPGGELMLKGGYGSFGDGGGGPGGDVNIEGGPSSDSHAGNVNISSGLNTWVFGYTGNLTLPANTFSVNYANGTQVSLGGGASGSNNEIQFNSNGAFSASGNLTFTDTIGGGTVEIGNELLLLGNGTVSTIGGNLNIQPAGNLVVTAGTSNLVFDLSGNLTIPGRIAANNIGNISAINLDGNASNVLYGNGVFAPAGGGSYGNSNVATFLASYGSNTITTTGNVTAGNITASSKLTANSLIAGTTSLTGAVIANLGQSRVLTLTPNPSYDFSWVATGLFGPTTLTFGTTSVTFTMFVDDNSTLTINVTSSNYGTVSVGDTAILTGTFTNAFGSVFFDGVILTVATINTVTPTAIDTTKVINQLSDGAYSLADGAEGQVLYLTTQPSVTSASTIAVTVANFRTTGSASTNFSLNPFVNGGSCRLLFTNGSWQSEIVTNISGNAGTANTLATARTINGVSFNGSNNITINNIANGNSNINIATASGNVVTTVNGSTLLTVYSSGIRVGGSGILQSPGGATAITLNNNGANLPIANITNTLNVTGAAGANITANLTAGNISTAGNITGNTNGFTIGYLNVPQIVASNTTLAATDGGKHYYSTTAGNLTLTIPNNSTTTFATGTAISIVVQAAGNVLVNAASGVTLYMAGNSTAANRVVGGYGMATLMKVATDTWFINGTGVS